MASTLRTIRPNYLQSQIATLSRSAFRRPLVTSSRQSSYIPNSQRSFSTQIIKLQKPNQSQEVSHEMPKINWRDLGANRTVKIVVIVALSIIGTMESIFYVKLFMRKFFPGKEGEEGSGDTESPTAA
ncbi:hypothetical protein TWF694_009701 [Orbilia ellipsospora]|uniref:Uncharacterized protein n=1 Tax=Orbilia ellipsospora TaxID=2528407 RepID=A0AAV9XI11_9PEZI